MPPTEPARALVCAIAAAALVSACASYGVRTDYDPAAQFEGLRTYQWMEIQQTDDPRVDNELLKRRIMGAVDGELASKGLSRSDTAPDLLVVYHAAVQRVIDIDTYTRGYGYRRRAYSQTYVREYDVGTLIIDLIQAETQQLVWRGSGQARLHERTTPAERDQRVRDVVAAILKDFPPGE
jgi:hypothetical protein